MNTVPVRDVAQQLRGVVFAKSDAVPGPREGYVAVLTAGNIQDGQLVTSGLTYVPAAKVSAKQQIREHDVVICASSGSLNVVGKAAQSDGTFAGGFGAFLKVLRPGSAVDPRYFAHYFQTPSYRRSVSALAAGANINNLKNEHLDSLLVPLPTLPEQRRIAAILDQADVIRSKRRQVLTRLDSLAQAIFDDAFGDPSDWQASWPIGTIDDLAQSVNYGTSAKAGATGEWPILRMGNITDDGRLDVADLKHLDLPPNDIQKYTALRGDMLFNRTNSPEKVGKAAVVRSDRVYAVAGYLIRVRFDDAATSEFVSAYLRSPHGRKVRKLLAKTAVNQANINATEMRRIPIALPPVDRRHAFASHLARVEAQREKVQRALTVDDDLLASLQSRAFRGEL